MRGRILLSVFLIVAYVAVLEVIFYPRWESMKESAWYKFYLKKDEMQSYYRWSDKLQMIGPKPGVKISIYRDEYVDTWVAAKIPGLDIGFLDNGLDPKKPFRFLVVGDSVGKGQGAIDPIRNGWVPVAERILGNVDLLNLSAVNDSTVGYYYTYDKVKDYVPHNGIIVSFNGMNDFEADLIPETLHEAIASLPATLDKEKVIRALFKQNLGYNMAIEFMLRTPVRSNTIFAILQEFRERGLNRKLKEIKNGVQETVLGSFPLRFLRGYAEARESTKVKAVSAGGAGSIVEMIERRKRDAFKTHPQVYSLYRRYQALAQNREPRERVLRDMAKNSARLVNKFAKNFARDKAIFLVIHPDKENVQGRNKEQDFIFGEFKKNIDPRIHVCDLLGPLRAEAKVSSEPLYYRLDPHPTPHGYHFIGEQVARCISRSGVTSRLSRLPATSVQ